MRFLDEVEITVRSGKGGAGCSSFRREKFVPDGGPDGGDGGRGGSVFMVAVEGRNTLAHFRGRRILTAKPGRAGAPRQKTGRSGEDLFVEVPLGTIVRDRATGTVIADLTLPDVPVRIVEGGIPGKGNMAFASSANRTPRRTTPGGPSVELLLHLELKLLADVGVIGFPNAGKSTLVSRISHARPRVADYPFTTLVPQLGVVDRGIEGSWVIADVPGLIEGAADGRGLGHQFLKHVQRTRLLVHLVSPLHESGETPVDRYHAIRRELEQYDPALAVRPEIIALTKIDALDEETLEAQRTALLESTGATVWTISSVSGQGLPRFLDEIWVQIQALDAPELEAEPDDVWS